MNVDGHARLTHVIREPPLAVSACRAIRGAVPRIVGLCAALCVSLLCPFKHVSRPPKHNPHLSFVFRSHPLSPWRPPLQSFSSPARLSLCPSSSVWAPISRYVPFSAKTPMVL